MGTPGHSRHSPDSDSRMISKSLSSLSAQADELRKRMECHGTPLPSWAEYKVYKAHDAIKDALSSTFGDRASHGPMPASGKVVVVVRRAKNKGANDALSDAGLNPKTAAEVLKRANAALVQQGVSQGLTPQAAEMAAYPPQVSTPGPFFTVNPAAGGNQSAGAY